MDSDYILVTNWEKVDKDEFYLNNEWGKSNYDRLDEVKQARKLQKEGHLFYGYICKAKDYALYYQLDANMVLINGDCDVIVEGESHVIGNDHTHREEYTY